MHSTKPARSYSIDPFIRIAILAIALTGTIELAAGAACVPESGSTTDPRGPSHINVCDLGPCIPLNLDPYDAGASSVDAGAVHDAGPFDAGAPPIEQTLKALSNGSLPL